MFLDQNDSCLDKQLYAYVPYSQKQFRPRRLLRFASDSNRIQMAFVECCNNDNFAND